MGQRRALKGIAAAAAASFVSRNNDFDGYWAIGRLHSYTRDHSTTKILIDLSGPQLEFASIASRYRSMIEAQAAGKGLRIHGSQIEMEFDLPSAQCIAGETGFTCSLTIVDDLGRAWSHSISGCCRPHDPKRELRRAPEKRSEPR